MGNINTSVTSEIIMTRIIIIYAMRSNNDYKVSKPTIMAPADTIVLNSLAPLCKFIGRA